MGARIYLSDRSEATAAAQLGHHAGMGLMPPYDPFADTSLAWAVARVVSIDPPTPTWSSPARVVFDVEEVLRGDVPSQLSVGFGQPREAGQSYFYATRGLGPPPHTPEALADVARQRAQLDATPVEVPAVGARVIVWLAQAPPGSWDIPTLRTLGAAIPPTMRSRWLEADPPTLALVRARVGPR